MFHAQYQTKQQAQAAGKGLLCPYCLQIDKEIELLGYCPDGINLNCQYRCSNCNKEWEGE